MSIDGRVLVSQYRPTPNARVLGGGLLVVVAVCCALALALLPIETAVGLLIGGIAVVLACIEPLAALGLLLLAIPISTIVTLEAGDFSVTAIEPLIVLLVVVWAARGIARRDLPLEGGPILLALGLLVLALLASSLSALRLGLAYKEIIKWLELVLVFLFTAAHLRSDSQQRALLAALFVAGAGEALYGIFQYATGQGPTAFTIGEALRAYGHFEQPNPFAGYLGTIFPIAVALSFQRHPVWLRALAGFAAATTGSAILLSLSRGAWVGVALGLAAMLAVWGAAGRRWLRLGGAGLAILVLLTATGALPGSWSDRLVAVFDNFGIFDVRTVEVTSENFAVVERMAHWQAGWYMLLDHPLFGVGAGNYPAAYDDYMLPGWREALGHAHNYYLNMAAETGLPGAAALVLLVVVTYRALLGGLKRQRAGSFGRALLAGLLASFVVLTVHNLFDNLLVHGMQVQVGFLLGLIAQRTRAAPGPLGASSVGGVGETSRLRPR